MWVGVSKIFQCSVTIEMGQLDSNVWLFFPLPKQVTFLCVLPFNNSGFVFAHLQRIAASSAIECERKCLCWYDSMEQRGYNFIWAKCTKDTKASYASHTITVSALLNIKNGKRHTKRKELGGHKKREREGRKWKREYTGICHPTPTHVLKIAKLG